MILSDYDVVSDEEVLNNSEKPVENKVMYDEALQMASSVHLTLVDHLIPNIGSIETIINNSDQVKDNNCCVQSNSKSTISSMNTSSKSEQLLDLYDVVNELDLLNCNGNVCILFYLLYLYSYVIVFCINKVVFFNYLVFIVL